MGATQEAEIANYVMGKVLPQCPQIKPGENYDFYVIPGGVHNIF